MSVHLQLKTLLAELDLDDEGVSLGDFIDKLVERDRTNALSIKNICAKFEEADRTFDSDDLPESVGQLFRSYQSVRDRESSLTKKLKSMEEDLASLRVAVAAAPGSHVVSLAIIRINSVQGAIDALYKALGVVAGDPQKVVELVVQDKMEMAVKLSVLERRNVELQKSLDAVLTEEKDAMEALFQLAVRCGAPPSSNGACSVSVFRDLISDQLNQASTSAARGRDAIKMLFELAQACGMPTADGMEVVPATCCKVIADEICRLKGCTTKDKPVLYIGANPMNWNVKELILHGNSPSYNEPARQLMQQLESKVYGPGLTFDGALCSVRVEHMSRHLGLRTFADLAGYILENYEIR